MTKFRLRVRCFDSREAARIYFEKLGSSKSGAAIMAPKAVFNAVIVENLDNRAVNILKQEMLALGGEAATNEQVSRFRLGTSDTVLLGTRKQFDSLQKKLALQPFGLKAVGGELARVLNNYERRDLSFTVGSFDLDLGSRPLIMGILNITPDSFSDGGRFFQPETALNHARQLVEDGADIIDIGGESSRPGAVPVSLAEEQKRVWPVIEALRELNVPISIDTYKAEVAKGALERGAVIINDISALNFDPKMAEIVAEHDAALVLMHMRGNPRNMQKDPRYENLIGEIIDYWRKGIEKAVQAGVDRKKIILDPGIGFGKTLRHNLEIHNRLEEFQGLGQPLLLGSSRKAFIGAITGRPVAERAWGTAASIAWAASRGINMVRVHDVRGIVDLLKVTEALKSGGSFKVED